MRNSQGSPHDRDPQQPRSWADWVSKFNAFIRTDIRSFADVRTAVHELLLPNTGSQTPSYPRAKYEDLCASSLVWRSSEQIRDSKLSREGDSYTLETLTRNPEKVAASLRKLQHMYASRPSDVHLYFAKIFKRLDEIYLKDPQYFYSLMSSKNFFPGGMHCPESLQEKILNGEGSYFLKYKPDEYHAEYLLEYEGALESEGVVKTSKMNYLDGFLHRCFVNALAQKLKSGPNIPEFDPREYTFKKLKTDFLKSIAGFLESGHLSPQMRLYNTPRSYLRARSQDRDLSIVNASPFDNPISPFLYPQLASEDPSHTEDAYEAFDKVYELAFPLGIMEGLKDPLDLIDALSQAVDSGRLDQVDVVHFRQQYSLSALAEAAQNALSRSHRLQLSENCLQNPIHVLNPFAAFESPSTFDHCPRRSFAFHNILLKDVATYEGAVLLDDERCQPYQVTESDLRYMASQMVGILFTFQDDLINGKAGVQDSFEELCRRMYPYFPRQDLLGDFLSSPSTVERKTTLSYQLQVLLPAINALSEDSLQSQKMLKFFVKAVECYLSGDDTYRVIYGLMKARMLDASAEVDSDEMRILRNRYENSIESLRLDVTLFSKGHLFPEFAQEQRLQAEYALAPYLRAALGYRLFLLSLVLCFEPRLDGFEGFGEVFRRSLDKWRQLQQLMESTVLGNQVLALPFFHAIVLFKELPAQQPK